MEGQVEGLRQPWEVRVTVNFALGSNHVCACYQLWSLGELC